MAKVTFDLVKDLDIFISTAAISDFEVVGRKNKKISSDSSLSISLKPTIKIIRNIKKINPDIFLVGFKAEFNITREEIIYCARKQINDAGTDIVIANDVSHKDCNFGSDMNEVLIIDDDVLSVPLASKDEIAKIIMKIISDRTSCRWAYCYYYFLPTTVKIIDFSINIFNLFLLIIFFIKYEFI